jgi:adenine-specific DNA-methyltransferase
MTPSSVAGFMAALFSPLHAPVRLLDAGAGIGLLSSAFLKQFPAKDVSIEAWEIDPQLCAYLTRTLEGRHAQVHASDFIEDAVWNVTMHTGTRFTHAILNPPYRKIGSASRHRLMLRQAGIETVNLYTAFLALAIFLMDEGGEIVAIVPRSFCNGAYYKPFRELLFSHCALSHIHVFDARDEAFRDDAVLQENVIIKLVRNGAQGDVVVSESRDGTFGDYRERRLSFDQIVHKDDSERYIHIPSNPALRSKSLLFVNKLSEIGLQVSTGAVVDFRVRDYCLAEQIEGSVPLFYPHHFSRGAQALSKIQKKPNAILLHPETRKWLMPRGYYVITKRFTTKEERRRVVAYVVDPEKIPHPFYGFENHLNVYHLHKQGIDRDTAYGLALFLNSTVVDNNFRLFSGHTQVNATDLRQMRYPSREQLIALGHRVGDSQMSQAEIDQLIKEAEQHAGSEGPQNS